MRRFDLEGLCQSLKSTGEEVAHIDQLVGKGGKVRVHGDRS